MEAALALPQLLEKLASRAPLTGIDVIGLRLLLDRADAGSDASLAEQLLADDPAAVAAEQRQHHILLLGLLNDVLRDLQKHGPRVGRGYTRQVRARDHRRRGEVHKYAPEDETGSVLLALWEEVLSEPAVTLESHFFQLGGDSLAAIGANALALTGSDTHGPGIARIVCISCRRHIF